MSAVALLRKTVSWVKKNPVYGAIGVVTPVVGLVAGLSGAWKTISEFFDIPECLTYSDTYYYYDGHFRNTGTQWLEFNTGGKLQFQELKRDRNYIVLLNKTPRDDPRWRSMLVRLPVCGGTAQWTEENPEQWSDLAQVSRHLSPQFEAEQAKLEQR